MKQNIISFLEQFFLAKRFKALFLHFLFINKMFWIYKQLCKQQFSRLIFVALLCSSCISFDLSTLKDKKASGVIFQAPPAPYKKVFKKGMDFSWQNPTKNRLLSFFSNCSSVAPFTSLEEFQKDLLEELKNFSVIYKKNQHHQGQKASYVQLNSFNKPKKVMELFLFKKAKCFYALSFLALREEPRTGLKAGPKAEPKTGLKARPKAEPRAEPKSFSAFLPTLVFKNFIQEFRAP